MVSQFNERKKNLILEYEKTFQRLKVAQAVVQEHKEELSKSVSPELKPSIDSILEADQFVVPPKLAYSAELGEVVASADYIGDKLHSVQYILGSTYLPSISDDVIKDLVIKGAPDDETSSKAISLVDIRIDQGEDKTK